MSTRGLQASTEGAALHNGGDDRLRVMLNARIAVQATTETGKSRWSRWAHLLVRYTTLAHLA